MGLIAVVGSALFFAQQGIGIGVGGMERVAVFPLPVWALCVGATLAAYTPRRAASMGRLTSDDDDMETDTS